MDEPTLPNQVRPEAEPGLGHYRVTLERLEAMSDDELRRLAIDSGVDGAQDMSRDHLISKLMDEPGANEL